MRRLGLILLAAAVTSGCFRSTTTITVKQDGSGVIDQEIGATAQAMALLRGFDPGGGGGGGGGGKAPGANGQPFGPDQARAAAASMGVRFVSGEPIKTAELEGYRAHFAFDDISKIQFNMKTPAAPGAPAAGTAAEPPPFSFGFARQDNASLLTIKIAESKPGSPGALPQMPGGGGSAKENTQALAMMMPMLRGLLVDVSLIVDGRVIKTNAPFVSGSQITLLQFDFDKVSATEGALQKLQQITDPKLLKDIPGVRMVTDPVVTIEFGR